MSKSKAKILSLPITNHANYNAETERQENVIGARIDEARRKAGLSLVDFSALLRQYGVTMSPSGINKWAKGSALPNAYQLVAVCHALDLDVDVSYFCSSHTPALNDAGLAKVREYKDDLIASGKYKPQPKVVSILKYIEMPVSNLAVSAGTGEFLDEGNFEMVSFPEKSVPKGADFGVRVSGDSMEPVYHDGQIVWVEECETLAVGEVGIFVYDGDGYLKVYSEQEPNEQQKDAFTDSTRKLALWSVVPAEKADCYRKVTVEHVAGGVMERKYCFPNAFVLDYKEEFGDVEGTGTFTLVLRQKKDKIASVAVEGNYSA